ncbi:hypothetical protein B0H63DRAFT_527619 [Podospora didyma]|uniref:Uncharacterized protein n=1 Tax=Podospora didyma TaxID=330526 RepID=A0AAE0N3X4_9PEZI|nr:hypothetical protein B0H63DRAFT_527619 [Podospora didyma]
MDAKPTTSIPCRNVDPEKLSMYLTSRFGKKGFRVELRHNSYQIRSRSPLSEDDLMPFIMTQTQTQTQPAAKAPASPNQSSGSST